MSVQFFQAHTHREEERETHDWEHRDRESSCSWNMSKLKDHLSNEYIFFLCHLHTTNQDKRLRNELSPIKWVRALERERGRKQHTSESTRVRGREEMRRRAHTLSHRERQETSAYGRIHRYIGGGERVSPRKAGYRWKRNERRREGRVC